MSFISIIEISFKALRANILRTGLAILGVVIGIASIVIVFSAGEGARDIITKQIEVYGPDAIETEIKIPSNKSGFESERQSAASLLQGVQITTLTLDDMEDITQLENIKDGYSAIMSQEPLLYEGELKLGVVIATTDNYIDIDRAEVESGRYFTNSEDKTLARVVVLGSDIASELFGLRDPIGESIKIRRERFRVIGVMEELGASVGISFDDFVYIPIRTMQKRIMGIDYVHYMIHRTYDVGRLESTSEQMRVILRENHDIAPPTKARAGWTDTGKDDFRVVSMTEVRGIMDTTMSGITILFLAILAVSLVVGGVGVMNVMYVIVNERTPEIGLRKAVGARRRDILFQFLTESVLITLAGGIVGIVLGVVVSYALSVGANSAGIEWRFMLPMRGFVIAIVFSIVFGVLFGIYPARKAARLDPVEALRAE